MVESMLENKRDNIEEVYGIICAEQGEIDNLSKDIKDHTETEIASRIFMQGTLYGRQVVLVLCRPGKVAASITATLLIKQFNVDKLLFVGVAGSTHPDVHIGDIVVGTECSQHDLDVRPFRKQYEVPELGVTFFESALAEKFSEAVSAFLAGSFKSEFAESNLDMFDITVPTLHKGLIVSGDQFIASKEVKSAIVKGYTEIHSHTPLACEMEGAAVAQVAYEMGCPALVVRVISDEANDKSLDDFGAFLTKCSGPVIGAIVREYFFSL
ncbi:5'-methylthioadenosine/S-adenosylhomocysteine nucleosidase [Carpediemonas membranifera]|uniref:adenosylhomocysteine nucleosidase n=1 Tax=Carpediemonas membranifera TaxID=201153 RepID=A0A8J6APL0_9EUKA|nr:5'-methylthioadenosine/S-adenosylhomocysteine nucleosidase [Carpediemonas membranifera]|eukprot:KAG9389608.1 5'-methylthioadenosine/S-adenosylhomocysteine nucleosidase [Carpediemonas membranifera]